jgi:mitochondrial fission protein ELM1
MVQMMRKMDVEADLHDLPDIGKARVLVLSDGRTGGENRSIGLAEMLGIKDPEVVTLKPQYGNRFLRLLPVAMLYPDYGRLLREVKSYDVLIGAGYQISRVMKGLKAAQPHLFIVALMRPAGKPAAYDVVAVEQHDRYKQAGNVVVTLGAPNRITKERLGLEADRWRKRLASVRGFKVALLIGGTSKHGGFGVEEARDMVKSVCKPLKGNESGVLVTTSRRTGPEVTAAVDKALKESGVTHFLWTPEDAQSRDNPYLAYLALADAVVVTADSVSMVSEAASAGKPVYIYGDEKRVPKKFRKYYEALGKQGRARWWEGKLNLRAPAAGLMDTMMVAGFVRAKWNKRGAG